MSYFIAISGSGSTALEPARGRLVAASEAQPYFSNMAREIAGPANEPVFLWDDGETGTSDDIVCEACDEIQLLGRRVPESSLASMLACCAEVACSIHVWWPSRLESLGGLSGLPVASSPAEAIDLFVSQASKGAAIGFVLQPNYAFKRTAGKCFDVS